MYGKFYIGNNIIYTDWNSNSLEWSKDNGYRLSLKFVQDERITPVGYLLYTHNISIAPCYQKILSKNVVLVLPLDSRKLAERNPDTDPLYTLNMERMTMR